MEERYKTRKNPVRLDVKLNDEQKLAKANILEHDIAIITGKAGSGKSLLSAAIAMDLFLNNGYEKIYIIRPHVLEEAIGFIPGDVNEKFAPLLSAIHDNFKKVYGNTTQKLKKLDEYMEKEDIELVPLAYMKGRTFTDSVILVEEAEDLTPKQMKLVLTRMGLGSIMLINGDVAQSSVKGTSGLHNLFIANEHIGRMCHVDLMENHRASIVTDILTYFEE